ncbi:DNA-directed RNA polymerase subunit alpha C-terminal domain-containing protein, partial [Staphylococcus epidermidis]|uniref:DNA-directed RNA polymerase subunit alpha C-terminal domain-containing protein n=1 Tax=Staphylococcus epidermidis TaxID=1282 RepID=UPI0028CBA3B1
HPQNPQIMIQKQEHQKQKLLQISIQQLHLSLPSYNSLKPPPINSLQHLPHKSQPHIIKLPNLPPKSLQQLKYKLQHLPLPLTKQHS